MGSENHTQRLYCISTSWSAVYRAHQGPGEQSTSAQQWVLLRYYQPIHSYLRAMVRDDEAAEELTHEFVVRFLRGDFRRADPSRGRFRDLIKRALRHLAIDHWRRQRVEKERVPVPLVDDWQVTPTEADWRHSPPPRRGSGLVEGDWHRPPPRRGPRLPYLASAEADRTYLEGWRGEMVAQAWEALAGFEEETGCPYHTVLSLRADRPGEHSDALARLVGEFLGRPLGEGAFRQLLHRSREKFADLLVDAVARTLPACDADSVEEELIDLGLMPWCRQSVARLRGQPLGTGGRQAERARPDGAIWPPQ